MNTQAPAPVADAAIGHNNPPTDAQILADMFQEKHGELLKRAEALKAAEDRVPLVIEDEETSGKMSDFIKQIQACTKALDATRTNEKEPFLTKGRLVDGFFNVRIDTLGSLKAKVSKVLTNYQVKKADEERRAREELARQQREEAARLQREAMEIEANARRVAEEARQKAEAEAKAQAAANAPAPIIPPAPSLDAIRLQKEAEAKLAEAARMETTANVSDKKAEAKASTMTKARGAEGSTASIRTRWVGEVTNREELDLTLLRQHIPADALQKALNSFVAAGGRHMTGAYIHEVHETVVR